MVTLNQKNGTSVQRRAEEYVPPHSWRTWLIGRPLPTADASHQTVGKAIGLAIFASDALSSTAYATQEMLVVLAAAGTMAFGAVFPISIGIVILLAIVTLSYEQTIHSYPGGGGSYIVARDNLGELPARAAGAALMTDYILTVAVSMSAGVAQIVSAYQDLFPYRVHLTVGLVFFVMIMNLRGVKESGRAFAIPSYFFVVMMYLMVAVGFFRYLTGALGGIVDPPELQTLPTLQGLTAFMILHAFANGTSALTGVEAISNGITAFKEPRTRNAGITLLWMSSILGSLFLGISFLSKQIGAVPSEYETVISQLARTAFDSKGFFYLGTITATTVILIMACNTSFAGFPRLSALMAADGFLPRQLAYRGSRLVYSRGILALALIAIALIILFNASVTGLIPLYAIGVFLSFTLSQAGMARRWWKIGHLKPGAEVKERGSTLTYESRWKLKMVINGFGAVATTIVTIVFSVTKFVEGAWIVLVMIPLLVILLQGIHGHYQAIALHLSMEGFGEAPPEPRHRVILPLSSVHKGTLAALRYAQQLSDDVTAVHVSIDPEESERVQKEWATWGKGVRLVILESPYRTFLEPLLQYIDAIASQRQPNETLTIIVPQFVPKRWYHNLLHTQTAMMLRLVLLFKPGVVIIDVPYQVG
jgi:amino acid transporter